MIWLEFIILLAAILIGARMKGIGLGVMGMVGLAIYIFLFRMRPAEPPIDVMLIILPGAKTSVLFFALAVLLIVLVGAVPSILPSFGEGVSNLAVDAAGRIKMAAVIELVMLAATAAIILFCKTDTTAVAKASLFTAGGQAVVSIFGVVWMSATFMQTNTAIIESSLGNMVRSAPWTFAIALFLLSILLFSQAATTKALMPLGMTLGILPPHMVAMFPAANGDFVLPGYPTLLAAINFDRTGSTHIGKFLVNHSFMIPGLVGVGVSVAVGFLLAGILF